MTSVAPRNLWLDNLKAIAIYLVVFGHILSNCMTDGSHSRVCGIIYFIHIPLFLMISGMLCKDKPINLQFFFTLIQRFVIPYVIWVLFQTLCFLGFKKLGDVSFVNLLQLWATNCLQLYIWFIRVYLIVYILWQVLKFLRPWNRLLVGTIFLIVINYAALPYQEFSLTSSLVLYTFTLFGFGCCTKKYANNMCRELAILCAIVFVACIPFATMDNNYFQLTFADICCSNKWYLFLIRFVAGAAVSLFCISLQKYFVGGVIIGKLGRQTLQIYLAQSVIVEIFCPRFFHIDNDFGGYLAAALVAVFMTCFCYGFFWITSKIPVLKILLWGLLPGKKP